MKASYDNELARAKALCHITNTLAPYPLFSLEHADEAILKLKSISEKQMVLIDTLRTNPVPKMSKELPLVRRLQTESAQHLPMKAFR